MAKHTPLLFGATCCTSAELGSLQAMRVGAAPPFALIVEDAARVEAEIAADRAHVAMGGAGDAVRGFSDGGIEVLDGGMQRQRG